MSLDIKQDIVATFGRHETFTLRYAWLKRGYDAVNKPPNWLRRRGDSDSEPYIFTDADAHHYLGVGKNMARSIRFWLQACRVVQEIKIRRQRHPIGVPTRFGRALLDTDGGLDPYTEQSATWWLLHWMMLSPGSYLPVWWTIFHTLPAVSFTVDQLLEHVQAQVDATAAWQSKRGVKPSTLRSDVLALVRNYAGTLGSRRRDLVDDTLDAPFVPLTLVRPTDEPHTFRFGMGPKPGLAPAVAAFACLDFLARTDSTSRQVLTATLASEQGGPGRAFKLTERDLTELLQKAAADAPDLVQVTSAAGSDALAVVADESLAFVAARLLHRHYVAAGAGAPEPTQPYLPQSELVETDPDVRPVYERQRS
jgi:hypothetical protein